MQRMCFTRGLMLMLILMTTLTLSACGSKGQEAEQGTDNNKPKEKRDVKLMLDWMPNTNHTGLYVAQEKGFYEEEGLNVKIVQHSTGVPDALIASGTVQFGVSTQESITMARLQNVPIVSIGAIIQRNTSGFAAPKSKDIKSPKNFEGKTYGGWGSPVEETIIRTIMDKDGGDYSKLKSVNMGTADYFTAVKKDIDFAWIYYAWTGIEAKLRNEPIDMLYVNQYSKDLDCYTPVLSTSEKLIKEDPELVKAFMRATTKGYQYAIDNPEDSANILLQFVPDLNKELVLASQKWLSPKYKDDAPRWGKQKREVWANYMNWLVENKLMEKSIIVDQAFTNDFLPAS